MTEARFQILFAGEPLPGVTPEALKDNLCRLFRSDRGNIERLFTGKALPLKRGLVESEAERYLQALQRAGAKAYKVEDRPLAPAIPSGITPVPAEPIACPKCRVKQEKAETCNSCGIAIEKFIARQAAGNAPTVSESMQADAAGSPYAPPLSRLGTPEPEVGQLKVFTSKGRIGRLRYLAWQLVIALLAVPLLFWAFRSAASSPLLGLPLIAATGIVLTVTSIQISIQRLHDMNRSGWLLLLYLVPAIGSLIPLLLALAPGNRETNRYGPPPPPNSVTVKLLAPLWLMLLLVGLLANFYEGLGLLESLSRNSGL